MTPDQIKVIQRTVDRLKEIVGGPPFEVRGKLRTFIKQLEEVVESNAASERSEDPKKAIEVKAEKEMTREDHTFIQDITYDD